MVTQSVGKVSTTLVAARAMARRATARAGKAVAIATAGAAWADAVDLGQLLVLQARILSRARQKKKGGEGGG